MPSDDILTTVQAAKLLHCSRQHVVHLCETGVLPYTKAGRYRRLRRVDVERLLPPEPRREDERSLWLNITMASKLIQDPDGVIERAKERLQEMRTAHSHGRNSKWFDRWQEVLDEGPHAVLDILTGRSNDAQAMRSSSPMPPELLTDEERMTVLDTFRSHWRSKHQGRAA